MVSKLWPRLKFFHMSYADADTDIDVDTLPMIFAPDTYLSQLANDKENLLNIKNIIIFSDFQSMFKTC